MMNIMLHQINQKFAMSNVTVFQGLEFHDLDYEVYTERPHTAQLIKSISENMLLYVLNNTD